MSDELITYTGREIRYFWGWVTSKDVTFGCIQTRDGYVEFYVDDGCSVDIYKENEPISVTKLSSTMDHFDQRGVIIRDALVNSDRLTVKQRQVIQDWYKWMYEYTEFYIPYP